MLDIRLIRRDPDAVRAALARRGAGAAEGIDAVLALDEQWRAVTAELRRCGPSRTRPAEA